MADLSSLLAPIGQHRAHHISPSRGKRDRKRKRQQAACQHAEHSHPGVEAKPPDPEVSAYILVGLSSATRHLQSLSSSTKPSLVCEAGDGAGAGHLTPLLEKQQNTKPSHLTALFVSRSTPPILSSHLRNLVATASLAHPELPATRLVQLPRGCDARVAASLGLPRAGVVGLIVDAPHSKPLVDFVLEQVHTIEVLWLKEMRDAQYLPVKINAAATTAPVITKKK